MSRVCTPAASLVNPLYEQSLDAWVTPSGGLLGHREVGMRRSTTNWAPGTTDQPLYSAYSTVHISASDYAANQALAVPVIRPDGSIVKGEGTQAAGWDTVTANGSGSFT